MRQLRELNLGHNSISEVEGLESCQLLQELNLDNNQLSSATGMSALANLKVPDWDLDRCRPSGFAPIGSPPSLDSRCLGLSRSSS